MFYFWWYIELGLPELVVASEEVFNALIHNRYMYGSLIRIQIENKAMIIGTD